MDKREVKVTGIKPTSVAMFEGIFGLIIGLVVAIAYWARVTIGFTQSTNSLLQGLMLGLGAGFVAVISLAVIYFVVGWVLGLINGFLFNLVLNWMGGLEIGTRTVDDYSAPTASARPTSRRAEPTFGETVDKRRVD